MDCPFLLRHLTLNSAVGGIYREPLPQRQLRKLLSRAWITIGTRKPNRQVQASFGGQPMIPFRQLVGLEVCCA